MSKRDVRVIDFGSGDYKNAVALRDRVLREPLGLKISVEDLSKDQKAFHIAAFDGGQLVGCMILTPLSPTLAKVRQVAVDPTLQKGGVGRALMSFAENFAKDRGFTDFEMSARDEAIPFYLKLGYEVTGEPYTEVTIPHHKMIKRL